MAKEITQQTEEQIRTRAYYLWEADGCPQGRDWEYWNKAKQESELQPETPAKTTVSASSKKSGNTERSSEPTAAPKRRNNTRATVYA